MSTHSQWANFLVLFGGPRPLGARLMATPIFPPKVTQKIKISIITWISHDKSIDNSLLSPTKDLNQIGQNG